jgi:phage terminase Nu1 subunit (DNA packaging protein)
LYAAGLWQNQRASHICRRYSGHRRYHRGLSRNDAKLPAILFQQLSARHLDLTHQRIHQLVDEHVIVQLPDGCFDMDDARIRYLRWLRDPERRSGRTQADAEHVKAKTEMLQLKLAEKRGELVRQSDVDALIDEIMGVTLTAMSSMPARCAPRGDLATRRCIEQVVFEVRTEIAQIAQRKADEAGEPPLSEQG